MKLKLNRIWLNCFDFDLEPLILSFDSLLIILPSIFLSIELALRKYSLRKVLVLDLDAERGDGTASIFQKNPNVVTFSIHSSEDRESHPGVGDYDMECEVRGNSFFLSLPFSPFFHFHFFLSSNLNPSFSFASAQDERDPVWLHDPQNHSPGHRGGEA